MKTKIKVSFIGAGPTSEEHIKVFSTFNQISLTGIMSRTSSKAKTLAEKYNLRVFDSIESLFDGTKSDLVVITVPIIQTYPVCMEAFNYPWKLLIEKPVGYNFEQSKSIAEAAKSLGRKAFVALNRRQYSSTKKVLEMLEDDSTRRVINVYDQEDTISAAKLGHSDLVIENWMYANSIHLIDFFKIFGRGEIESVTPIVDFDKDIKKNNFVAKKISFSSGDIGLYQCYWNMPAPWSVTLTTSKNRWEMKPLENVSVQHYPSRVVNHIQTNKYDIDFKPGFYNQAIEAIKASKDEDHNLLNLEDSLDTMKLIQQLYE